MATAKDDSPSCKTPNQLKGYHSADADFSACRSSIDTAEVRPKSNTLTPKSRGKTPTNSSLSSLNQSPAAKRDATPELASSSAGMMNHPHLHALSAQSVQSNPHDPVWRARRSSFFRRHSVIKAPPDLLKIRDYFTEALAPNNRLHIRSYIQGFKEVVKFLCALGSLLSFASRDIDSKVVRIDELLSSDHKMHYLFLDDMLKFELDKGMVNQEGVELTKTKSGKRSGTRIMFRLHQALAFLVLFFTNVREMPHAKMQKIVNEAYKGSVSKNHGWLVRKTATLAFHVLPTRSTLITRIGPNYTEELAMKQFKEIVEAATAAYNLTAKIFDTHSNIAVNEHKTPTEGLGGAKASDSLSSNKVS